MTVSILSFLNIKNSYKQIYHSDRALYKISQREDISKISFRFFETPVSQISDWVQNNIKIELRSCG